MSLVDWEIHVFPASFGHIYVEMGWTKGIALWETSSAVLFNRPKSVKTDRVSSTGQVNKTRPWQVYDWNDEEPGGSILLSYKLLKLKYCMKQHYTLLQPIPFLSTSQKGPSHFFVIHQINGEKLYWPISTWFICSSTVHPMGLLCQKYAYKRANLLEK